MVKTTFDLSLHNKKIGRATIANVGRPMVYLSTAEKKSYQRCGESGRPRKGINRAPMSDDMILFSDNSLRPLAPAREKGLPLPSRFFAYCRHSTPVTTTEVARFEPKSC